MSFRLSGVMKHLTPPQELDGEVLDNLTTEVKETVVESGLNDVVNETINNNISIFNLMGKNLLTNPNFKFSSDMSMGDNKTIDSGGIVTYGWETETDVPVRYITSEILPENRYGYAFKQKDILKDGSCSVYTPLDGSGYDVNGDYEVVTSDDMMWGEGLFGPCAYFGGANDTRYVGIKSVKITKQMSFSFLVKLDAYNTSITSLVSLNDEDGDNRLLFRLLPDGKFQLAINNSSTYDLKGNIKLPLYKWNFLTLVVDGTTSYIKLNGEKYYFPSTPEIDTTYSESNNAIVLGQEQDSVLGSFDSAQSLIGSMSDFRVFNKALTDDDINKIYVEDYEVSIKPHIAGLLTATPNKFIPFKTTIKNSLLRSVGEKLLVAFNFNTTRSGTYCMSLYSKDTDKTYNIEFYQDKNEGNKRHTLIVDTTEFINVPFNDEYNMELIVVGYDKDNLGVSGINTGRKIGTSNCVEVEANDMFIISELVMQPGTTEQPVLNMEDDNIVIDTPFGMSTLSGKTARSTDICAVQGPVSWNKDYKVNWAWLLNFDNKSMRAEVGGIRILEDGYYEFEAAQRGNEDAPDSSPYIGIALDGNRYAIEDRDDALSKNFWAHDHTATSSGWTKSKFYGFLKKDMLITTGTYSGNKDHVLYGNKGFYGFLIGRRVK